MKFDLVTVVFEAEYDLLALQARSISRYVSPDEIAGIYVVDNSQPPMDREVTEYLLQQYGDFADIVRFVHYRDLNIDSAIPSYIRQQIAKLQICSIAQSDWYVSLDAKNHFINSSASRFWISDDQRFITHRYSYQDHPLREKLKHVLDYVGLAPQHLVSDFTPTVTPYPLHRETVKALIATVERNAGVAFADEFARKDLTEFFLYGAWLHLVPGRLDRLYKIGAVRSPNVWPKSVNDGGVQRAVEAAKSGVPLFTVHRKALWRINDQQAHQLSEFWFRRGLFPSTDVAFAFIERHRSQRPSSDRGTFLRTLRRRWRSAIKRFMRPS